MSNDLEVWCGVPSEPRVEASSWGRVRLTPFPFPYLDTIRMSSPKARYGAVCPGNGYLMFGVPGGKTRTVHRLVCEAFHGPQPSNKPVVMHQDDSRTNNKPENLAWGTQKENLNTPRFRALQSATTKNRWEECGAAAFGR